MCRIFPSAIGDVHGGPVVVREGAPDRVLGVERDRILDALVRSGPADVVGLPLERELGSVDADNDQALIPVLLVPCADVAERAQPVDARVRPEVDQDDLPAQALRSQRLGVEPAGRAVKPGQMRLRALLREQAHLAPPAATVGRSTAAAAAMITSATARGFETMITGQPERWRTPARSTKTWRLCRRGEEVDKQLVD